MDTVDRLYKQVELLFVQHIDNLTNDGNTLRFSMLPVWATLKRKQEDGGNEALDLLYKLWDKLESITAYRGNSNYTPWVEARIAVIKAVARLDGQTGYMVKSAIKDGSLPQKWRAVWAYLNVKR